jgi:hypothetical protein
VADTDWKDRKVDPVPGIFQQIAAIAAATIPPPLSPAVAEPPSSDSEEMGEETSSEDWESDASESVEMKAHLELDVDTGEATFSTS